MTSRPLWKAVALVVGSLVLFYVVSYAWFTALHSSGAEKNLVKDLGGNTGTLGILAACAVTCVVAPICEELLFRGFIFRSLRNWRGVWPAAAITGVLFGAVHGLSAPAVDLLPLAFLGFVLCIVYQRSGSLYPCIALHVLNNAIAFGGRRALEDADRRAGRGVARGGRARARARASSIRAMDARERLIALLREHALVIGEIVLTSGARASYYVDAKRATLLPEGFAALGELVAGQAREWGATAVGG